MTGICPFSQVMKPRQNVTELVGSESTIHLYNCGLHGVFSVLKPAEGGRAGRWGGGREGVTVVPGGRVRGEEKLPWVCLFTLPSK